MKKLPFFRQLCVTLLALAITASALCPVLGAEYKTVCTQEYALSAADFTPEQCDELRGVYICQVPDASIATFQYGGRALRAGDVVTHDALDQLVLSPACADSQEAVLTYCPITGNHLGEETKLTIQILPDTNEPPIANDSSFETYKNIANNGTLSAKDPEGGALTYTLVKEPKRGDVTLNADGTFVYTPKKNKVGKDAFSFTVTDEDGNTSEKGTVSIRIKKPTDAATYADLTGNLEQFEALWLRESGLFSGSSVVGEACFSPDESMTRGQFLVMLMRLADIQPDDAQLTSGFSDEADAPDWMRPYLTAALRRGLVTGVNSPDGLLFLPEQALTRAEAAVMLQTVLGLATDPTTTVFSSDETVPIWASASMEALSEAGITLPTGESTGALTRLEAASLLYQASSLLEA